MQSHSPLESLDPEHLFDVWEYILYIMTASFFIEGEYDVRLPSCHLMVVSRGYQSRQGRQNRPETFRNDRKLLIDMAEFTEYQCRASGQS